VIGRFALGIVSMWFFATSMAAFGQSIRPPATPSDERDSGHRAAQLAIAGGSDLPGVPDSPQPAADHNQNKAVTLPRQLLRDQIGMWSSPARIRLSDATWLAPLGGFAAGLLATDSDVSRHLSDAPDTLLRYRHLSDYGVYSMAGGGAGIYLLGLMSHNEHQRESGLLSGEAAVDSLLIVEALKYATRRQRPLTANANGQFWQGGTSFPSEHAAEAWSIAGVIAHEYPNPFVKFLSYGMATAISASRVEAKQHFPSDVLVGSALGYLVGYYVYREHHSPELSGGVWKIPAIRPESPSHWKAKFMGSPYVSLDSWIYPALNRLTALGYIDSSFLGMRPWTRMECARLVEEAQDRIAADDTEEGEPARLYGALQGEFVNELKWLGGGNNAEMRLESAYTRSTEIVGRPLTDGYHFGQTVINDYGRPYQQGFNNVSGLSGWAADGPFVGYLRVEYQHAPTAPPIPDSLRLLIQQTDGLPAPPSATPVAIRSQFDPQEAYVGMNFGNWQVTYGKQALWWGPDASGPMMFSNNAEPIRMLKIDRVSPFKLPSILGLMGPVRWESFLGQLGGHDADFAINTGFIVGDLLNPQPMIVGHKLSFKPTPNVEFGISYNTIFAGEGIPFTLNKFLHTFYPHGSDTPGNPRYPGDAQSAFDLSYRLPWLRNRATFYADGYADDQPSPLAYWDRSAWVSGIYIPRIPGIPKLDLRAEGVYSDLPIGGAVGPGFFYSSTRYKNGYTNWGNLMGSWIGRGGQGAQAWTTYWFTPRNNLQFSFRHQKVSREFIPNGGTLTDASVRADFWVRSSFSLSAAVQYEAWNFPVVVSAKQSDVTSSVRLAFWPKSLLPRNRDTQP
jgi:membrane-associated phospholipid phosphatase